MTALSSYLPQILAGTWITIQVAVCSLLLGLILGLIGASLESAKWRPLRYVATSIISIIRGLPELLVLFFIYFGGTIGLTALIGHYVNVSAFVAGVVGLALIFGSYASQVFRGAFLAIPIGQIEAARALGLNRRLIFTHIKMPQAWRHALPGLGNLWLVLLKDTALVSLIGLADLMNKSQVAASTTHQPFVFFLTAAVLYLIMTSFSQQITQLRTKVGMVFQQFNLWAHKTVIENLIEAPIHVLKQSKAEAIAKAEELLNKVGLESKKHHYPGQLSGGQQQRAAIARALMMTPEIMLFDEPTSALDPEIVGEVLTVMHTLANEGMTMLVASHELGFARNVANQAIFLDQGIIVEHGNTKDMFNNPQTSRFNRFLKAVQH